eukprot:7381741-Prymnesium_polylepis.1
MSTSLIYAAQHAPSEFTHDECYIHPKGMMPCEHPLFRDENAGLRYSGSGVILKPGVTRIACGKAGDSGGECGGMKRGRAICPGVPPGEVVTFELVAPWDVNGDGCGGDWRPEDFPGYLERQAKWQVLNNRLEHNEARRARSRTKCDPSLRPRLSTSVPWRVRQIIIESMEWNDAVPALVDAFCAPRARKPNHGTVLRV